MSSVQYAEEWVTGNDGLLFYTRFYTPASELKGCIVLVHGFIEHIGRFDHVACAWKQRGFAVFAWDQRGFGRTALDETKRSKNSVYGRFNGAGQLGDIEFFLGHARTKVPQDTPVFLYGHSMGGGEVLSYTCNLEAARDDKHVHALAGVIASSPFLGQARPVPKLQRTILTQASKFMGNVNFPATVQPDDLSHDKAVAEAFVADPLVKQHASLIGLRTMFDRGDNLRLSYFRGWPEKVPLLVVHGDEDGGASYDFSKQFFDKLVVTDKTFSPFKGARHEIHNEPDFHVKFFEETISWAEKQAAKLHKSHADATPVVPEPSEPHAPVASQTQEPAVPELYKSPL